MKTTIIPSDKIVIVDGVPLTLAFDLPRIHAVQIKGSNCEIDYTDGREREILESVPKNIQAIIDAHQAEMKRLSDEAAVQAAKIASAPKFFGKPVLTKDDVDRVTIERVRDRICPDGDTNLKLNAELHEMKMAIYAVSKLVVAVIVPTMTSAQKTALKPLLDQVNSSIALTDEVIAIRDEGEAFKQAQGW